MVFTSVLGALDLYTGAMAENGFEAVATYITPALYAGFTLYVMLTGIKYLLSPQQGFDWTDFGVKMAKVAFIIWIATDWNMFYNLIFNAFYDFSDWLTFTASNLATGLSSSDLAAVSDAGAIINSVIGELFFGPLSSALPSTIIGIVSGGAAYHNASLVLLDSLFIQQMFGAGIQMMFSNLVLEVPDVSMGLLGPEVSTQALEYTMDLIQEVGKWKMIIGLLFYGTVLSLLLTVRLGTFVLVVLAPVFIGLFMFEQTRHMGESWLKSFIGLYLVQPIVTLVTFFVVKYTGTVFDLSSLIDVGSAHDAFASIITSVLTIVAMFVSVISQIVWPFSGIPPLVLQVAAMYFLGSVPHFASSLVGGHAVGGGGEMAGSARQYMEAGITGRPFAGFMYANERVGRGGSSTASLGGLMSRHSRGGEQQMGLAQAQQQAAMRPPGNR